MSSEYEKIYEKQILYRAIGIAIADNYKHQMMRCPVHLSIGQEYWLPFIDKHNKRGNRFFSTHRSHSLYMALNCDIKELIAELRPGKHLAQAHLRPVGAALRPGA